MIPLVEAAEHPDAGAKAATLGRLRAQGFPVLDGLVVLPGEVVDGAALRDALMALGGGPFAVRSSASVEDRPGASAAGVFASEIGVPAEEVLAAIGRVRAGVDAQAAQAYLLARGLVDERPSMAVLVQPALLAARLGVLRIEAGILHVEERPPGQPEWSAVTARVLHEGEPLARLARRLGALLGEPLDVEYALQNDEAVVLQARPVTAAPPTAAPRPRPDHWRLDAPGAWWLDEEHNPEPLSEAQAGLVERASEVAGLPAQRVVHGWLFYRPDPPAEPDGQEPDADAVRRAFATVSASAEALLAPLESAEAPDLAVALSAFDEVVRLHGASLRPVLRAARGRLDAELRRGGLGSLGDHGELLSGTGGLTFGRDASLWRLGRAAPEDCAPALAEHLARFGAYAPAWDVAAAHDDEAPARVMDAARLVARGPSPEVRHAEALQRAAAALARLREGLPSADGERLARRVALARDAMEVAEDDDLLYHRAQRLVRRALLARARHAGDALDHAAQIFDLPLARVLAGVIDAGEARGASALRAARSRLLPPQRIVDGVPEWRGASGRGGDVLVGAGTAGRGYGRVQQIAPGATPVPGAVLVARALLPSMTWMIPAAAGLVTDVGGALSHAATLAREHGVPAVLGTGRATLTLLDGDDVVVDADRGRVYRLGRRG